MACLKFSLTQGAKECHINQDAHCTCTNHAHQANKSRASAALPFISISLPALLLSLCNVYVHLHVCIHKKRFLYRPVCWSGKVVTRKNMQNKREFNNWFADHITITPRYVGVTVYIQFVDVHSMHTQVPINACALF